MIHRVKEERNTAIRWKRKGKANCVGHILRRTALQKGGKTMKKT